MDMVRIVGFDRTRVMAYRSGFNWACWVFSVSYWYLMGLGAQPEKMGGMTYA